MRGHIFTSQLLNLVSDIEFYASRWTVSIENEGESEQTVKGRRAGCVDEWYECVHLHTLIITSTHMQTGSLRLRRTLPERLRNI